jgi:hypothetical protein
MLDELVALYRGWDQLERKLNPDGQVIIDFDLAKNNETFLEFNTRFEVLTKLKQLQSMLPPTMGFLHARLKASICYVSALMGQQFPFDSYIASTMELEPYQFAEAIIQDQRDKVIALLTRQDIQFDRSGLKDFEDSFFLTDEDEIKTKLYKAKNYAFERLGNFVCLPPIPPINIQFKKENAYWQSWINGSTDEITLTVNLHPRGRIYDGIPQLLAYHEIASHAVQMSFWLQSIDQGNIHPIYGITTVHSPEQFISEGLAQTITDILLEDSELSIQALMAREYERYRLMVYNNAQIMINEQQPIEVVLVYVSQNLPFESTLSIEAELRDRSYNPLLRAYEYVYSVSEDFFLNNVTPLSSDQKKTLLPIIYREPLTKQSLQDLLGQLQRNELVRSR